MCPLLSGLFTGLNGISSDIAPWCNQHERQFKTAYENRVPYNPALVVQERITIFLSQRR